MAYRSFIVPRNTFYGPGALEGLTTISGKRALIVTDSDVRRLGFVERVEKILRANNTEVAIFDETEPDPSKETVWSIFSLARDFQPDLFVGLGGGSAIDAGKAAWVLYENPDLAEQPFTEIARELRNRTLRSKARYVAIATTSGTGSEATAACVITNKDVEPPFKTPWVSSHMVPDVAIVDPELAASMPPSVTTNTGFDAMVHALECYVLTQPSDLVDSLAIGAAKVIWEWLPRAVADGRDMVARDKMSLAALQAGIAFTNGRLGLVHGLAHQIGAAFGIPHGRANAFMLCPVFAFLYPTHKERLSSLAVSLGIAGKDDQTKVNNLLSSLDKLKQAAGIPLAIKESGQDESSFRAGLDPITESYMNSTSSARGRMTPDAIRAAGIPMSADEIKELFQHAWNGTRTELK